MGRRLSGGQTSTLNAVPSTSVAKCPRCDRGITDRQAHTQDVGAAWTLTQLMNDKDKMFVCLDT